MTGQARFAKGRLVSCAFQHPLRGLDVHPFDHLIPEPLGAAVESRDERLGALYLGRTWGKRPMAGRNLVGVYEALAVEPEPPARFRFSEKALRILEIVEDSVEGGDTCRARGKDDQLQRGGDRLACR